MLKLGFLSITGCSFWNIFFPPRGGLGPKGCVGRTLMINITIPGYLSLNISPDAVPGRVTLAMTTILTLTAMFSGVRHSVPKVSYISYLDIWMLMCLIFVNLFMFEFVCVVFLKASKKEIVSQTFERKARLLFPVAFVLFNVIYWPAVCSV